MNTHILFFLLDVIEIEF